MSTLPQFAENDALTTVIGLQSQYSADIIGLPIADPLLTWQISSSRPDAVQVGYEISSIDESGKIISSALIRSD
jgi:alpha-L-rhamnosidase